MVLAAEAAQLSSGWFLENAWLIPLIPGIAFFAIMFFGKKMPQGGSEIGIASIGASLVLAIGATYQWIQRVHSATEGAGGAHGFARALVGNGMVQATDGHAAPYVEPVIRSWTWWQNGGLHLTIGQQIDGIAVMLLLVVTFISFLVQIYSTEYVKGDRRYTQFFGALTLFSAGMLVMVLAESMIQFILGWELMGLCSFMLIGHWWEDKANSRAALKAFFTVRTGDVGLLVGTGIIYFASASWAEEHGSNGFSIQAINGWAASNPNATSWMVMGAVALFIAAIGKSGQFPLHTWLPDAMAGPTPVSSLLHSSTMVVAGVFLVARLYPVFFVGLDILDSGVNFIAVIGGITIIMAAALAFVQTDIKKVLAYSTVSQLGYMMLGLGVGAWLPAVFHIFTHAFFKCALFLAAGSISHSGSHHSFDMKRDMGGLRKHMPITFWVWMLSTMALCGVPLFSGFWSKDEIIDNADHNGYTFFFYIGLIGAAMTAGYMTRATYLTFFGKPRGAAAGEHHDEHPEHEVDVAHATAVVGDVEPGHVDIHAAAGAHADDGHGDHHDDHHGDHHGPHESPWKITAPLVILGVLAVVSGFLNAPGAPFKTHLFQEWVEPSGVAVVAQDPHSPTEEATADDGHTGTEDDDHGEDTTEHDDTGDGGDDHAAGVDDGVHALASQVVAADEDDGHDSEEGEAATEGEGEGDHADDASGEAEGAHGATGCGFDAPPSGEVCYWPSLQHATFKWAKTLPSIALVAFGALFSLWVCLGIYAGRRNPFAGLTRRFPPARGVYAFLVNKYYLDHLYEGVIVRFVAHPAARAFYWFNQNVIDRIVNLVGSGTAQIGRVLYRRVDQGLIDRAVNLSGDAAEEGGEALQSTQSGFVSQYGALLFGAASVFAIALLILNV